MKLRPIAQYFKEIEKILKAQYTLSGTLNNSDKGENREELLLNILNNHLPAICKAHRGGIVQNVFDEYSSQIDIVIYSSFSPILNQHKKALFLIEGTYGVIEVKSILTKETLKQILISSSKIKSMEKFVVPHDELGIIQFSDTANSICAGVFAYESTFKDSKQMFKFIKTFCIENNIPNTNSLDFICVLDKFCLKRQRIENISGMSISGKKTIELVRKELRYDAFDTSFATMLENILEYVSYYGPTTSRLSDYLHPFFIGNRSVGV